MITTLKNKFPCEVFFEFRENLTIPEYANLFSKAKIVIGPHGAGLSNVVFTEPLIKKNYNVRKRKAMIEFNVYDVVQLKAYSRLALITGMRYYGLLFGKVDVMSKHGFPVDVNVVSQTVDKALKYVNSGVENGDNAVIGEWNGKVITEIGVNLE